MNEFNTNPNEQPRGKGNPFWIFGILCGIAMLIFSIIIFCQGTYGQVPVISFPEIPTEEYGGDFYTDVYNGIIEIGDTIYEGEVANLAMLKIQYKMQRLAFGFIILSIAMLTLTISISKLYESYKSR